MPPKEADKLYAEQLDWVKPWTSAGAPWLDDTKAKAVAEANAAHWSADDGITFKIAGGHSEAWSNRRYKPEFLWAYQADQPSKLGQPVDALRERRFHSKITPAGTADARTMICPATFDLTGLPPTPEGVSTFEAGPAKNAKAAMSELADRLLLSTHYTASAWRSIG